MVFNNESLTILKFFNIFIKFDYKSTVYLIFYLNNMSAEM